MTTLFEDLKRSIARLEKKNPESKLLQDYRRQLKGLEAANGKTAKEIYYSGVPSYPTNQSSAESDERRTSSTEKSDPLAQLDSSEGREERIRRYEKWRKENPPEPISDELRKKINELM
jgi:hypothetical protein